MTGCFSWCPKVKRKFGHVHTFHLLSPSIVELIIHFSSIQRTLEDGGSVNQVIPSKVEYMVESAKKLVEDLEAVSGVIPVPFIKEFLGAAIKLWME